MKIGIIVGEVSGDLLGAALVSALQERVPNLEVEGILGPRLLALGGRSLYDMESLSVMGIVEPLKRLPTLLRIRSGIIKHFKKNPPDVVIGVDSPDFNLSVERSLKKAGIKTVHYVSPSVWAWRKNRIHAIKKSVDLMLTLFPFEVAIYKEHQIPVKFIGHPLADSIPLESNPLLARQQLGLPEHGHVVAVLPGSRRNELKYLAQPFIQAMVNIEVLHPNVHFVVPMANEAIKEQFKATMAAAKLSPSLTIVDGQSLLAMQASDVVMLSSGTATLEAMLLSRPMVVAYKMATVNYWIARMLIKINFFSLPNILFDQMIVPELLQHEVRAEVLANKVVAMLESPGEVAKIKQQFDEMHRVLKSDAAKNAAEAVLALSSTH